MCSQAIDSTVDVGIFLVCCGSCQELRLTPMQHVLTLTMGVQLSKLAMSMHEDACRWSVTITGMAISSGRWAELRLRGRVYAWTEACRVRASRCGWACQELSRESSAAWSKEGYSVGGRLYCSVHPVRQCNPVRARRTPIHEAVGPAVAEAAAECWSMNQ